VDEAQCELTADEVRDELIHVLRPPLGILKPYAGLNPRRFVRYPATGRLTGQSRLLPTRSVQALCEYCGRPLLSGLRLYG
jgi:hypothetical protein